MFQKKKFDKVNGEDRECKVCKQRFHTMKPRWVCMKCVAKQTFETAKQNIIDDSSLLKKINIKN